MHALVLIYSYIALGPDEECLQDSVGHSRKACRLLQSFLLVHGRDGAKRAPVQVPDRAEAHAEFATGVYMMGEPGEPKFRTATR